MAWTAPSGHVYAVGEALSAATLNTYVKDNLIDLDRRTTTTGASVLTVETTTSLTFAALATSGPAVTVTIGTTGLALVSLYCSAANSAANVFGYMGFAISGASTVAASLAYGLGLASATATGPRQGATFLVSGLSAGSNTFTAQYRVESASTGTFADRRIMVTPLGS